MSFSNPKVRRAALAFIFVTAVLDIVAMGIIIPVLPQLIEDFVGSNARAGVINGVFVALWAAMQTGMDHGSPAAINSAATASMLRWRKSGRGATTSG